MRPSDGPDDGSWMTLAGRRECVACSCNGHSDQCDPVDGVCLNCQHNTEGSNCEICSPGYYGDATSGEPYGCLQCPCLNLDPLQNNIITCYQRERDVVCLCPEGHEGDRCER
ncbi:hypothetical protein HELRODRAFT_79481 [Helobdella robusta]|uniref:Laminin EGF-like domain-containing protein n=1 Tax=Helobdella robusta TaxID=6412 RepID=T1G3P3_HELRO|nr:hypothetical protein HELRODRAFT_79481 [Helobdella robusta]ESO03848.1 hypothetical protein HELRODRAFT_79481 [Helobdella robusta]